MDKDKLYALAVKHLTEEIRLNRSTEPDLPSNKAILDNLQMEHLSGLTDEMTWFSNMISNIGKVYERDDSEYPRSVDEHLAERILELSIKAFKKQINVENDAENDEYMILALFCSEFYITETKKVELHAQHKGKKLWVQVLDACNEDMENKTKGVNQKIKQEGNYVRKYPNTLEAIKKFQKKNSELLLQNKKDLLKIEDQKNEVFALEIKNQQKEIKFAKLQKQVDSAAIAKEKERDDIYLQKTGKSVRVIKYKTSGRPDDDDDDDKAAWKLKNTVGQRTWSSARRGDMPVLGKGPFTAGSDRANKTSGSSTSESLGMVSSKKDDFSLSSEDFPILGSEKDKPSNINKSKGNA